MAEIEDLKTLSYTSAGTNDPNTDISAPNPNAGTWGPGEEITINKLNHMDTGIVNATEGVKTLAQAIDSLDVPNITGLTQDMTNVKSTLEAAKGTHASMLARLNNMEGSIPTAQSLTTQITAAVSADATVSSMSDEIQNAHRTGSELVNPANNYVDSLDSRFDDIEAVLRSKTNNSKGVNLNARFIALEAAIETITGSDVDSGSLTALAARIAVLENALKSALDSDEDNVWETLDDYLSDLEQDVANLKAEVGQFDSSRIDVLEAEVEAAHRTLDGGATDSLDNRFDDAEDRLTALETSIGDNEGNSLSGRVAALETIDADTRLDNLETIVGNDDPATGLQAIAAEVVASRGESANLDARLDTLAVADTVNSALNTKAAASDLTALAGRVTTLEGKDTIIVNKPVTGSNYNNNVPNIGSPSENADYLIQADDDKYYYWRYINNTWEMISGAGGGGTGSSSGEFAASLAAITHPDENIDYFVGNDNDGYIHYRYIPSQDPNEVGGFVQILPKNLINSLGVASINVTTADATDQLPAAVSQMSGGILAYDIGDTNHSTNLLNNFTALRYARLKTTYEADGITLKKQELIFTDTSGQDMAPIEIKGGGGGSTDYNIRLIDIGGATSFMAPASADAVTILTLKPIVNYGNTIAEGVTVNATVQYKLSTEDDSEYKNADITIPSITNNSNFNLNVSSLLGEANTTTDIRITTTTIPDEVTGTVYSSYVTYHITTVTMTIESIGFDQAAIRNGSSFDFTYKCIGYDLSKIVTFIVDNGTPITEDIGKSHNEERSKSITLTGLQDGMHTLQVYYSVGTAKSNILNYYFIYNSDANRTAPIVAVAGANASIHYGDDLTINYTVYTAGQETTDEVDIEVYRLDGVNEISISSFSQSNVPNSVVIPFIIPEYPLNESQYTIYVRVIARKNGTTILSDTATASITILPADFDYQLKYADPDNRNLLFMYNVAGKSNNDINKEVYKHRFTPKDGNDPFDFTATFNNFNWATNGYIIDKTTGENSLVISGGANCTINVPVFSRTFSYTPDGASNPISVSIESDSSNTSINTRGRTVELDYEVVSTVDANSTIIECMGSNGAGIRVTPQSCYLVNSTTAANISQDSSGFINNESSIAAAYLSTGQRIHLVFVIEPEATVESSVGGYHQCVNIYINGEFANSQPYTRGTVFSSEATMTIGNATSLIKLYGIRMYNRGFSDKEVLQNYMMAPSKINDKLARFEENNVLDNESGLVSYSKAMKKYNCLLLTGVMSPYKGSPSTIRFDGVDSQNNPIPVGKRESALVLTKPNAQSQSGYVTEFELYDKLNDGGYASSNNVQGTSSQKYPVHNLKVYLAKGDDTNQQVFDTNTNISVKKIYKYSVNNAALAAYNSVYPEAQSTPDYIKDCADNVQTIIKNLAVVPTQAEVVEKIEEYLTAEDPDVGAAYAANSTGDELIIHPTLTYKKAKKVKYQLNGANSIGESTLCWKADYMSTDHANTYNANMANDLFTYKLPSQDPEQGGDSKVQNTVKGIRCLLFVRSDENSTPVFIGDGCLNNDKGNNKTFGLEHSSDNGNDTLRQKWEFTNNSEGLCLFKSDHLYEMITTGEGANQKTEMRAKGGFESTYPDEGDLEEEGLEPNYTHLQILLTWVNQRANFWDASTTVETTTIDDQTVGAYLYNGTRYNTEQAYRKAIFLNEFNRHFVLNHVLTYYLLSEFIALCDNRAKNMFLRCDNVRSEIIKLASDNTQNIIEGNEFGDDGTLWNQLVTPNTGVVDADMIDWENSTFAVWAPVLYDLDSCYGVENVGYLTIPYDADWYYNLKGWSKNQISKAQIDNPNEDQISFQFSGVASRLWLMVEEVYGSNIQELAKTLYSRDDGLNYYNIYTNQIEDNLAETSPALINQDMILKFQNPWETGFIDYSQKPPIQSTEVYKYLQRGSKTSQKDSFVYRRSTLLSSKYQADNFIKGSINFRTNVSVPDTELEKTSITITANQMIYPAVTYGDNKAPISSAVKIAANTPCTFQATAEVGATDTIHIAGGAVLTDIGDLSKWSPYEVKVGLGANLKRLILGKKDAGYENLKLDRLDLTNCQLLETINVENCKALEELDVSKNGLIKEIYTFASNVKKVIIPNGGVLTTLQLGSHITEIKIQNQSQLTNFSYEGDDDVNITNPYASVNTLWIENTPSIPIVDIIVKNISNLTGGIRLNNIDVDLGNDPTFLQILTSQELMKGKYINTNGELDANQYPYITGKVKISKIRASLLAKIKSLYKNLIVYAIVDSQGKPIEINGNDIIQEFEIRYYNYGYNSGETEEYNNQWLLYTDHRTDQEHYIDPASTYIDDLDPVTGQARISIPTKPADAQYSYTFGTYTDDGEGNLTYDRFSGWKKEGADSNPSVDDYVDGTTVFIAQYPTVVDQFYTVRWFAEPNENPIQSIPAKYGTDITLRTQPEENNSFAKAKFKDGVYKVFKGWNRPIGKLVEDTDIYALWETSSITGNSIQSVTMNTLTAADLYALSSIGPDARNRVLNKKLQGKEPIAIKMGNDFYYTEGTDTVDLLDGAEKIRLTGESSAVRIKSDIKPLATLASDWTIALDYKFLMDASLYSLSREFVLLSCYQNADGAAQGFKVSLNKGTATGDTSMYVYITWGNTTTQVPIDYLFLTGESNTKQYCRTYRNVVVLRHSAAEPEKLYYYSTGFNGHEYNNTDIISDDLTWNSRLALNTPLILGGNYSGTSSSIEVSGTRRPARAMVYYAKYWNTDLGRKNCRLLAAWPHETEYFLLSGYDNNQGDSGTDSTRIMPGTKLTFTAAQGFGDRTIATPSISNMDRIGWSTSSLRTLCNDRIYNAFPMTYRSIMNKYTILSTYYNQTAASSQISSDPILGETETQDYIYLPSEQEVSSAGVSTTYKEDESLRFWPWLSTSNIKALTVSNDVLINYTAASIDPLRYRFLGRPFSSDTTIFYNTPNPASVDEWTYQYTDAQLVQHDEQISVQSGDVWFTNDANVNAQFSGSANAYIYYTNAEINEGVYVDIVTTNGGWKRAGMWELRTYNADDTLLYGSANRFEKIDERGTILYPTSNNVGNGSTRILCPEFAI